MRPQLIVFASAFCLLPVLSAQPASPSAAPAVTVLVKSQPDLSGEAVVIDKENTIVRFAKDGSSVRTLYVSERARSSHP